MESNIGAVRECAQRLLARREHSQLELERKLQQRDFSVADIEQVLTELAENNLQCDKRFAESYVRFRGSRGYGPLRIRKALQDRGVSADLITAFVSDHDVLWFEHAQEVREKKFGEQLPDDFEEKAKQMRFLQYRGFTLEQINKAFIK